MLHVTATMEVGPSGGEYPRVMLGALIMVKLRTCLVGASLLLASLISTGASATTIIGTLQGVGHGDTITLHAVYPNQTPIAQQVLAGAATFSRSSGIAGGTDTAALAGGPSG